jgi:hypothetical protein
MCAITFDSIGLSVCDLRIRAAGQLEPPDAPPGVRTPGRTSAELSRAAKTPTRATLTISDRRTTTSALC